MEGHIEKYFSELEKYHFLRLAVYHVDEQIELNQKKHENKKERSYLHNRIQKKIVSVEIDHAAVESLNQKKEVWWEK